MPGVLKINTITRIILASTIVTGFLIFFVLSCEIFDYERIVIVETGSVIDISSSSVEIEGKMIDLGESEIVDYGHIWAEKDDNADLTIKLKTKTKAEPKPAKRGNFTSIITGLSPDTDYKMIAYATNSQGTVYGKEETYKTLSPPGLAPKAEFMADQTNIQVGGSVEFIDLSSNNPTSWRWNFGDGGNSILQNPLHYYESVGTYSVSLIVSNSYGSDTLLREDFITVNESSIETGTYIDRRDDHEYSWVKIGEQIWMAENLAYLPEVFPPEDSSTFENRKYVYGYDDYSPDEAKAMVTFSTYGVLYNWPAAMDDAASSNANPSGVQGICPDGWHLPSNDEWFELIYYVGDNLEDPFNPFNSNAGGKLKEVGNSHWTDPNEGATNITGFTGLPGGACIIDDLGGYFTDLNYEAWWWSSTASGDLTADLWNLTTNDDEIHWYYANKSWGLSVRCVKDGGIIKKRLPGNVDYNPVILKQRR